jgi:hypothetical protein
MSSEAISSEETRSLSGVSTSRSSTTDATEKSIVGFP